MCVVVPYSHGFLLNIQTDELILGLNLGVGVKIFPVWVSSSGVILSRGLLSARFLQEVTGFRATPWEITHRAIHRSPWHSFICFHTNLETSNDSLQWL